MKILWAQGVQKYLQKLLGISLPVVIVGFTLFWVNISYWVYRVESADPASNIRSLQDSLWWGVVTGLTVGYGDRYPVTAVGRLLGVTLMFGGVLVTSLITAKISSIFFEAALKKRRGFVETKLLKDHFIICGWTEDMEELLLHILDFNNDLDSSQIVVIAHVDEINRETIWSHPRLKDVNFLVGEYYTDVQLRRTSPEKARKVLILADRTVNGTGQVPTPVEIDARTIMTAMSLSNISRGTLVAAEILDPKMDQYLKIAGVSEIIYSREYSRLLIGNASGGTGVVNILFDLLDPGTPSKISTLPVPNHLVGKTFREVKNHLEDSHGDLLIVGILENYGNQHSIKELALRKAQQTPDIHQLVTNLHSVREIKCNHPIFNPRSDYVMTEGAMVIGIENRNQGVQHGYQSDKAATRVA